MQELTVPIAILSTVVSYIVALVKTLPEMKEDDVMENKIKRFVNMNLDILYVIRANSAGGVLLAKALQLEKGYLCNQN